MSDRLKILLFALAYVGAFSFPGWLLVLKALAVRGNGYIHRCFLFSSIAVTLLCPVCMAAIYWWLLLSDSATAAWEDANGLAMLFAALAIPVLSLVVTAPLAAIIRWRAKRCGVWSRRDNDAQPVIPADAASRRG